ncbi:MAG TPA: hypothetical protein VLE02_00960 [Nitrosarchaeum sp.]|nr:hypothetical protein [Nitrosarchaeum sp.]
MKHIKYTETPSDESSERCDFICKGLSTAKTVEQKLKYMKCLVVEFPLEFQNKLNFFRDTLKYDTTGDTRIILSEICRWNLCDEFTSIQLCVTLYNNHIYELCYDCFRATYTKATQLSIKLECLYYMMNSPDRSFVEKEVKFILQTYMKAKEKYSILVSFSRNYVKTTMNSEKISVEYDPSFIFRLHLSFFENDDNDLQYRLLSASLLLQLECEEAEVNKSKIILQLKQTAEQSTDDKIKAEIVDIIRRLTKDEWSNMMLEKLSYDNKDIYSKSKSIYANKHNVHGFEDKVEECVLDLIKTDTLCVIEDVQKEIAQLLTSKEKLYLCRKSLNRISQDLTTYTAMKVTLVQIVEKMWHKICTQCDADFLKMRFIDELIDMSGTCGTGHLIRLFNIFDEYKFTISFEEQLKNNVIARIGAMIKQESEEKRDNILLGMAEDCSEEEKKYFTEYLSSVKKKLYEELHKEFVDEGFMTGTLFDSEFEKHYFSFGKSA